MFQFPSKLGFKSSWFEALRFVKPLTFFVFLNIPLSLIYFKIPGAEDMYFTLFGLACVYFILAGIKEKKFALNSSIGLIFLALIFLTQYTQKLIIAN